MRGQSNLRLFLAVGVEDKIVVVAYQASSMSRLLGTYLVPCHEGQLGVAL